MKNEHEKALHELHIMQQVYGTLFSVTNKIQIRGDDCFEILTSRQFMTIVAVLHLPPDETTINNIASKLGTSKQNANRLVVEIEKRGLLKTFPSEKDKRAVNVKLTESGEIAIEKCGQQAVYFMADIFNKFSTEEVEILWKLLKKLYSFDGEMQDGFEKPASVDKNVSNDVQTALLEKFMSLRKDGETK